jgi:hypothetical protein
MAIRPKQILDGAFHLGKAAVSAADRRLRGDRTTTTSGAPTTVGAAEAGGPGAPKSATAATETAAAASRGATGSGGDGEATTPPKPGTSATPRAAVEKGKAPAESDKTSTPRTRPTGRRTTASRAAASSGQEVADAASGKDE